MSSRKRDDIAAKRESIRKLFAGTSETEIIMLVREWFDANGEPPRMIDWDPSTAVREGQPELAERFFSEGCWPLAGTVRGIFGSFTAGIIAAGFYPRMRTAEWKEANPESRGDYLRQAVAALKRMQG